MLTQPQLMRLGWFARLYRRWFAWKTRVIASLVESPGWIAARARWSGACARCGRRADQTTFAASSRPTSWCSPSGVTASAAMPGPTWRPHAAEQAAPERLGHGRALDPREERAPQVLQRERDHRHGALLEDAHDAALERLERAVVGDAAFGEDAQQVALGQHLVGGLERGLVGGRVVRLRGDGNRLGEPEEQAQARRAEDARVHQEADRGAGLAAISSTGSTKLTWLHTTMAAPVTGMWASPWMRKR